MPRPPRRSHSITSAVAVASLEEYRLHLRIPHGREVFPSRDISSQGVRVALRGTRSNSSSPWARHHRRRDSSPGADLACTTSPTGRTTSSASSSGPGRRGVRLDRRDTPTGSLRPGRVPAPFEHRRHPDRARAAGDLSGRPDQRSGRHPLEVDLLHAPLAVPAAHHDERHPSHHALLIHDQVHEHAGGRMVPAGHHLLLRHDRSRDAAGWTRSRPSGARPPAGSGTRCPRTRTRSS